MTRSTIVFLWMLFVAIAAGRAVFAEGTATWRGYVIDRQCAESVKEDSDPKSFIKHHSKDCSLMPTCRDIGYSLYSNDKWLDLDKKGNDLAIKLLKASKKKSGFYVVASGSLQGKVLKVQSMKEIDEPVAAEDSH